MSLKELRGMLKEQRKTNLPPVSKMKKGAIMREVLSAEQILHKSRSSIAPVPIHDQTYGAEEITRRLPTMRVSEKKAVGKIIGARTEDERLYTANEPIGLQPMRKAVAKQADEPVYATQKVAPATKKQTAKKTALAEENEPVASASRDINAGEVIKRKPGRPRKEAIGVGVGEVIPTGGAPYNLVVEPTRSSVKHTKENLIAPVRAPPAEPNLTRLVKPMKYGGGVVERNVIEYVEPEGKVKKEVVKIEKQEKKEKVKRPASDYNKFVSQQRKAGYSMAEVGKMWAEHKSKQ